MLSSGYSRNGGPALLRRPLVALQDPSGDDQALDLAGAFVNFGDARIAVGAFDWVFAAVAVAAMNLNRFMRDARGHLAGKKFRDGRFHRKTCTGILFPGRTEDEQASRFDFRGHIREHELNGLKIGDGMAEGLALLCVA